MRTKNVSTTENAENGTETTGREREKPLRTCSVQIAGHTEQPYGACLMS